MALRRDLDGLLAYAVTAYMLIIMISTTIVIYWRLFDFGRAPGGLIYIGAYAAVAVVVAIVMVIYRIKTIQLLMGRTARSDKRIEFMVHGS